jgi:hypothetical protein
VIKGSYLLVLCVETLVVATCWLLAVVFAIDSIGRDGITWYPVSLIGFVAIELGCVIFAGLRGYRALLVSLSVLSASNVIIFLFPLS